MQWKYLTGGKLYGYYAKDISFKNNFNGLATVYKNTPSFLPEVGDIFVMDEKYGEGAGHTGVVWSANLNTFVGLEQNWYGGGRYKTEVAQLVIHTYDMNMYFIRSLYKAKATVVEKVKDKVATVPKPKVKGKVVSNNVSTFTKVKTIKFNFIVKADGYWWISYTFKGKTYYSAICKITDKKERIKLEKYCGKLKWNWYD